MGHITHSANHRRRPWTDQVIMMDAMFQNLKVDFYGLVGESKHLKGRYIYLICLSVSQHVSTFGSCTAGVKIMQCRVFPVTAGVKRRKNLALAK